MADLVGATWWSVEDHDLLMFITPRPRPGPGEGLVEDKEGMATPGWGDSED